MLKRISIILFIILISGILFLTYKKNFQKKEVTKTDKIVKEDTDYNSNIIKDVSYSSKDSKGNEYQINAEEGEIDYNNSNIIFLKNLKALIKLENGELVNITSNYGKYNTNNFDTIFTKNVIIKYTNNKITSDYLDFSINRNLMIISKNVIFTNLTNALKADVIEIDLKTKDTQIFMYENNKKVNIKSKN